MHATSIEHKMYFIKLFKYWKRNLRQNLLINDKIINYEKIYTKNNVTFNYAGDNFVVTRSKISWYYIFTNFLILGVKIESF